MVNFTPKLHEDDGNPFEGPIEEIMDKQFVFFDAKVSIEEAIKKILRTGVTGAPVVDENHKLVGYLSQRDCLKQAIQVRYLNEQARLVEDYMVREVASLHRRTHILAGIQSFIDTVLHVYPVVNDDNKVVGVVRRDAMLAFVSRQNQTAWKRVS